VYFLKDVEEEAYDNCHYENCGNPNCEGHSALENRKGELVALVANRSCTNFNEMIEN